MNDSRGLKLDIAFTASDRTRPLLDGRVSIEGVEPAFVTGEPEELFRRALREQAFDITELSMASHIVTTARGDSAYIGVPVFPSRAFRHSGIYVRKDAGITRAEDLAGRKVGLPEYQQTAAMWVRGILSDEHGVKPDQVHWVVGSQEQAGGTERTAISVPDHITVTRIGPTETLSGLMKSGEIDAIVTPRPPSGFLSGDGSVMRLFDDYKSAEMAYYRRTGFFPIMHCIAIRRTLVAENPWLPAEVFKAFCAAKAIALDDLQRINFLRVALPWVAKHFEETKALMGGNIWPYGYTANADELAAMVRYAALDGLSQRTIDPASLFHESTYDLSEE